MSQKRILFLGASAQQIPPIKYALDQGHYVITCDYLPGNPGHQLAHEWHNVSTTDKEAVLSLARELKIDGIVAYASDPAAPTQAYVAEKMELVGNPYESVEILARKDYFREFLVKNGFNTPRSESFYELDQAKKWLDTIGTPAFIKPIDSSGSKGVTNIKHRNDLEKAFNYALSFSREKKVVVEEAIARSGYQVDSDIFMSRGEIVFWIWGDQHQDILCHPYAPIAISFPSVLSAEAQVKAKNEVEAILKKLGFMFGAFNVEFVVDEKGDVWVIEIGPRNGGNLIPQVIKYVSNVDMIAATVDESIGKSFDKSVNRELNGYWSSYIVHAREDGIFKELYLSERVKPYIVEQHIYAKAGDEVRQFSGSQDTLGMMILKYPSMETMLDMTDNMENDILVLTEER
ncbi:ATP-grasp domain-containing protein [Bermanella marisrubri]|uniref:Putative carbamoyl-phosphate-synthetase n=1 Tax=Bermanella marisrubri TaxID=207949 RepID=Q1N5B3_9GAMM|nr:ATP-grasp domain-containing protein [Bermanella marisrubri]EAT13135.1 putative carbamoyl-phosphate-synthetase [Oceanobacter sp. RED65] [Bermanella marisrubri]QIZ83912.1 ATP-grasp domain-containing protein [Bermanella marisrubri]